MSKQNIWLKYTNRLLILFCTIGLFACDNSEILAPTNNIVNQNAGCLLGTDTSIIGSATISSGERITDTYINSEFNHISNFFGFRPVKFFYNDYPDLNGYVNKNQLKIYLGLGLIRRGCSSPTADCYHIPYVIAHQFGHCYALTAGRTFRTTVNQELFADFMAGAYLYYSTRAFSFNTGTIAIDYTSTGKNDFVNTTYHGELPDRNFAISKGFSYLKTRGIGIPVADIAQEGFTLYP